MSLMPIALTRSLTPPPRPPRRRFIFSLARLRPSSGGLRSTGHCGAAAQLVQTDRPFKIPSATCRGLLEGYRFSKYSRAAAADWAFLVPHLSTLCTLRARTLVCSTTANPISYLDLGSSDKQSL